MGISVVGAQAESGSNDFTLNIGTSGNTTFALDKTYPSGRYEIDFINNDTTYDIYAVTSAGSYVGYTNSTSIDITQDFRTVVVLGAANSEKVTFTFSGPIATAATKGDVTGAAAFLSEVVTAALPNIDDTTVINGGNFAADVEISFIGQDTSETDAKNVVRSSSTQLVVTRPDSFTPDESPYTVKAVNPGIPAPTGSNAHLLSNSVTAGTNPVWTTDGDLFYNVGAANPDITLLATDTEGSDIDYSVVSGTLPVGLTLDGETGVISGTFSGSASEGDSNSVTFRAVDAGGNFLDKAFNFIANTAPTWTTASGALDEAPIDGAYSYQLQASSGAAGGALTFSLASGSLLTGHTLSSSGLVSGTSPDASDTVANFTVRVTDENGLFTDRSFSITVLAPTMSGGTVTTSAGYKIHTFTSSGTLTVAGNFTNVEYLIVAGGGGGGSRGPNWGGGGGGGGAGGVLSGTFASLTDGSYGITIGAGGAGGRASDNLFGQNGGNSTFNSLTAIGGGRGGKTDNNNGGAGANGGSGGGAASANIIQNGGSGVSGQGSGGGQGNNGSGVGNYGGGGGGGYSGVGKNAGSNDHRGGAGLISSISGTSLAYAGGGGGSNHNGGGPTDGGSGVGGTGSTNITDANVTAGVINRGGGGGGASEGQGGNGGSGIVIVRYAL